MADPQPPQQDPLQQYFDDMLAPVAEPEPADDVVPVPGSDLLQRSLDQWLEQGTLVAADEPVPALIEPSTTVLEPPARLECLLFSVNQLKLAVPLTDLGSICEVKESLTVLPGQGSNCLGMLHRAGKAPIRVLNTALCLMPERYDASSLAALRYVVILHGTQWGIACDQVMQTMTLARSDIKWRTQRGKRPWLAGTVIAHMCSLLDPQGLAQLIPEVPD